MLIKRFRSYPGYDGAQIIEVLTEQVDERYLGYLEKMKIPYIFAGEKEIDVDFALFKLKNIIGCKTLLLEGGSIINGHFLRTDCIDEISLVQAPVTADSDSKPLFYGGEARGFSLSEAESKNGALVMRYFKSEKGERNE